ncbi:QacE family quaternary ammonium compound efflux SMR transporter [Nostoc sp. T09]|uniref:quaternary ammonium compound efflux SMR transporter SugE n=1 Tax=Nostoc sp. T09 TaxID=1932621 RepID=UPI000A3D57FE|nr:quaternary ammonium compound efflux SMR transporter SugE [Nostoc sp. T09]OUL33451.1 QacE family quaternary ammonium compound efflux SMR transporter [Nostoc sp. T09]
MAWIYLLIAGVLEMGWAIGLKYTQGFTKLGPSIATVACMVLSFAFLSKALRTLPVGTAYATWTGIGAAGTAVLGVILFGEPAEIRRFFCIGLIMAGVLGIRLVSSH